MAHGFTLYCKSAVLLQFDSMYGLAPPTEKKLINLNFVAKIMKILGKNTEQKLLREENRKQHIRLLFMLEFVVCEAMHFTKKLGLAAC